MSSTCSPLIQSVMDTPGAALSVLPQMHDRGSAGNAFILYNMQHNAQNPSCIDLCIIGCFSKWLGVRARLGLLFYLKFPQK